MSQLLIIQDANGNYASAFIAAADPMSLPALKHNVLMVYSVTNFRFLVEPEESFAQLGTVLTRFIRYAAPEFETRGIPTRVDAVAATRLLYQELPVATRSEDGTYLYNKHTGFHTGLCKTQPAS